MKKNTVCVYDTISKSYVEVEVSCEVYTQYNRTKLAIENNNSSFFEHEIQFSALIGGTDGCILKFQRTHN